MRKQMLCSIMALSMLATNLYAEEPAIPRFEVRQYLVEGNTVLSSKDIADLLKGFTGKEKDFADIQQAMDAIEKAYKNKGYNMATVLLPEQELSRGEVIINVIEPRIKDILVEGNTHYSRDNILRSLPAMKAGQMPRISDLAENLRAANENPGKKVGVQFKQGETPTDLNATVKVEDKRPFKVFATADNTGTKMSGEYRIGLGFQHYNLFDRDHILALQYQTSTDYPSRVSIASGSYRIPFYSIGDTLDLFGGYSNVSNGTSQISGTDIQVAGEGIVGGVRYNLNLQRIGDYEHKLIIGADYRFYDNSALMTDTQLASDITTHPFSLTYALGLKKEHFNIDGYVGGLHNDPWGHKGNPVDFEAARSGANPRYWIVRYGMNTLAKPFGDWLARLVVNGQYTDDRLISGEQFGLGGASSVRGYQEREEAYDAGLAGSAEIYTPDFGRIFKVPNTQIRLLGFYDAGYGYNVHLQAGENKYNTLDSVGAGIRVQVGELFNFGIDGAIALRNTLNYRNSVLDINPTRAGDNRIHFKAQITY